MSGPDIEVTHIQLTLAIMVVIPLTVMLIRATVMATAMGVHMPGLIGAKAAVLLGELIGDGIAGTRRRGCRSHALLVATRGSSATSNLCGIVGG